MRLWIESFSTCQILNREFIVPEDIENKTFWIINFWRKYIFQKPGYFRSIFIQKSDFDQKFTSEKKLSDSICSGKNNIVFSFRAYFKRHDFEVNLFFENQKSGIFWKKIRILKRSFFPTNWKVFESRVFRPGGFRKFFSNNRFVQREFFFWNLDFEFHFHWGSDFDKNITSKK